ncbi:hypothetical protein CFR75_10620 [Komagataeibacter xylinus]|uniref:YfhO family protein n=2 Tax=Komagataeibacter xylinus TaxID=28448 RepID=A0A318PH10_KOMXY|nr:hypothetical protein CFR75_10620 [Komagataeibacter xylinus]
MDDISLYYSGLSHNVSEKILRGEPSIDPNIGYISLALTWQGVHQLFTGHLPLWNYYEGFGQPLMGEMQAAPFFPPSWLVLLPQGVFIEHAVLQWIGALGAYLFFRKFGLSRRAAVTGAIMWEVNGVFTWLQNTVFNPVAFLPWLLYFVESLFVACRRNTVAWRDLTGLLCGGILMGTMSLYSGFPEVVYLYCLFVLVWSIYRLFCLPERRQRLFYIGGLGVIALGTLILVAPLLTAFFEFLKQAYIGRHAATNGAADNYANMVLPAAAMARYLFPYAFGEIFVIDDRDWYDIGGYIGLVPFLVALASLFAPGRRTVKMILLGWVVFAVGASHGMPVVHAIAMHIPGVGYAESCRFLNSGWLFCMIFACALFVDQLPGLSRAQVFRTLAPALGVGGGMALFMLFLKRGTLVFVLADFSETIRLFCIIMLVMALIGAVGVLVASLLSGRRSQAVLMVLLVTEVTTWYFVPFLSYPRKGELDQPLITFLQKNVGFSRVVNGEKLGMNPNFGSYFDIPEVNFNDLPTPLRTVDYIHAHLDPFADGTVYIQEYPYLSEAKEQERRQFFRDHMSNFGATGIKYAIVNNIGRARKPINLTTLPADSQSFILEAGQRYQISVPGQMLDPNTSPDTSAYVTALDVWFDTGHAKADGVLKVSVCVGTVCTQGTKNMAFFRHKAKTNILLDHPQRFSATQPVVVTVEKVGGVHGVAFRLGAPVDEGMTLAGNAQGIPASLMPALALDTAASITLPAPVSYQDADFTVYEIPGLKPYFYSDTCKVHFDTRETADVTCAEPGSLKRLELFYPGWRATVDGVATPIDAYDDAFQAISLPAGQHHVVFRYAPAWLMPSLVLEGVAWFALGAGFFVSLRRRMDRGLGTGAEAQPLAQ